MKLWLPWDDNTDKLLTQPTERNNFSNLRLAFVKTTLFLNDFLESAKFT